MLINLHLIVLMSPAGVLWLWVDTLKVKLPAVAAVRFVLQPPNVLTLFDIRAKYKLHMLLNITSVLRPKFLAFF